MDEILRNSNRLKIGLKCIRGFLFLRFCQWDNKEDKFLNIYSVVFLVISCKTCFVLCVILAWHLGRAKELLSLFCNERTAKIRTAHWWNAECYLLAFEDSDKGTTAAIFYAFKLVAKVLISFHCHTHEQVRLWPWMAYMCFYVFIAIKCLWIIKIPDIDCNDGRFLFVSKFSCRVFFLVHRGSGVGIYIYIYIVFLVQLNRSWE